MLAKFDTSKRNRRSKKLVTLSFLTKLYLLYTLYRPHQTGITILRQHSNSVSNRHSQVLNNFIQLHIYPFYTIANLSLSLNCQSSLFEGRGSSSPSQRSVYCTRRIINFRKQTPNVVFVEKPAETQTSIWLARHLVRAPNS
jgi:hypothetical protein